MELGGAAGGWMLRFVTHPPLVCAFRNPGTGKPRRNVATLFEALRGRSVEGIHVAERDRVLIFDLRGLQLRAYLFGPRANVFLTAADGVIVEAFKKNATWAGKQAPPFRPAAMPDSLAAFQARWRPASRTTAKAVSIAMVCFDLSMAEEARLRAGVTATLAERCSEQDVGALFAAAMNLRQQLRRPEPRIYWVADTEGRLALTPLAGMGDAREERFASVDEAVRVYARHALGALALRQERGPLQKALNEALDKSRRRAENIRQELRTPSRADGYERWAHLLMASGATFAGEESVTLRDIIGDDAHVCIPLRPSLGRVENAERYYGKARKVRQARKHALARLALEEKQAKDIAAHVDRLGQARSLPKLKAFKKTEALARLLPKMGRAERLPFRRYAINAEYTVLVGRNARDSDEVTTRYARPFDVWMHARGVRGAHVVLRLPYRNATPAQVVLERAAAIAAYHSKARGSALAPVIVTPRKHVRKPKGAAPGVVTVDREEVMLVEPGLPPEP